MKMLIDDIESSLIQVEDQGELFGSAAKYKSVAAAKPFQKLKDGGNKNMQGTSPEEFMRVFYEEKRARELKETEEDKLQQIVETRTTPEQVVNIGVVELPVKREEPQSNMTMRISEMLEHQERNNTVESVEKTDERTSLANMLNTSAEKPSVSVQDSLGTEINIGNVNASHEISPINNQINGQQFQMPLLSSATAQDSLEIPSSK